MSFTTEAVRWRALTSRDPSAEGHFVYSVKSTNIYCRPTCPARLARRANVGFYKTPAQAEAAGFRSCKRCKPHEKTLEDPQERAVAKACVLIEEAVQKDNLKSVRLQDLAKSVGLTPRYFHKIFKDRTGQTPKDYAKAEMAERNNLNIEPTGNAAQMSSESMVSDSFDFNDLLDFGFDPALPLDTALATQAFEQPTSIMFGHEIDVNIQPLAWSGIFEPNVLVAGNSADNGKHSFQPNADSFPDFIWEPYSSMIPAVSTFQLDAAFILGDVVPEVVPDVNV